MSSGGRFEFDIGTGIPAARESAEQLGMSYGTGAERLSRVAQSVDRLRELDGDEVHTPVLIAAGGPKARQLAATTADTVTLATGPLSTRAEVAATARELLGQRSDLELAMTLFAVGDDVPAWAERFIGTDARILREHDSLVLLRGSAREMADELQRRRDLLGVSYITVNGAFVEQLAPVIELLDGR